MRCTRASFGISRILRVCHAASRCSFAVFLSSVDDLSIKHYYHICRTPPALLILTQEPGSPWKAPRGLMLLQPNLRRNAQKAPGELSLLITLLSTRQHRRSRTREVSLRPWSHEGLVL